METTEDTDIDTKMAEVETRRLAYIRNCRKRYRHRLVSLAAVDDAYEIAVRRLAKAGLRPSAVTRAINSTGLSAYGARDYHHLRWFARTPLKVLADWYTHSVPQFIVLLDPVKRYNFLKCEAALNRYRDGAGTTYFASEAALYTTRGIARVLERVRKYYPDARAETLV